MEVVRGVNRESLSDLRFLIRMPRFNVRPHGIAPSSHLVPRMRRHVVDMAGAWNRFAEKLGAGFGALRHDRRFSGVHVEMASARVVDVFCQHLFEDVVQVFYRWVVDVARAPPRLEQKQRIGIQRGGLEIVRVSRSDLRHRLRVGLVLLHAFGWIEFLDVTDRHRIDEGALLFCRVAL